MSNGRLSWYQQIECLSASDSTYSEVEKKRKGEVLLKARAEGRAARARAPTRAFAMMRGMDGRETMEGMAAGGELLELSLIARALAPGQRPDKTPDCQRDDALEARGPSQKGRIGEWLDGGGAAARNPTFAPIRSCNSRQLLTIWLPQPLFLHLQPAVKLHSWRRDSPPTLSASGPGLC